MKVIGLTPSSHVSSLEKKIRELRKENCDLSSQLQKSQDRARNDTPNQQMPLFAIHEQGNDRGCRIVTVITT